MTAKRINEKAVMRLPRMSALVCWVLFSTSAAEAQRVAPPASSAPTPPSSANPPADARPVGAGDMGGAGLNASPGYGGAIAPGGTGVYIGGLRDGSRDADPVVDIAPPVVDGPLPAVVVRRIIMLNRNAIRYCYANALRFNPSVQGLFVVRIMIAPSGAVTAANTVADFVHDETTTRCMLQRFQNLSFPSSVGPATTATVRLHLRSEERRTRSDARTRTCSGLGCQ